MTGRGKSSRLETAQSRHCSLDSADRRAASASTVTQLHCTVDICRFIELPRPPSAPLQQNTETHIPARPSPAQPPPHQINEEFSCPIFGSCCQDIKIMCVVVTLFLTTTAMDSEWRGKFYIKIYFSSNISWKIQQTWMELSISFLH